MAAALPALLALVLLAAPEKPLHEVASEAEGTKLFLPVRVNGSEALDFILDTGFGGDFLLDRERAETLGLALVEGGTTHTGAGEGKTLAVARASGVAFEAMGVKVGVREVQVFPFDHVSEFIGRRVDGLVGNAFFARFVVEIDYPVEKVRLHDKSSFSYDGPGRALPIVLEGGHLVARARVRAPGRDAIEGRFVVDTGAATAIHFSRPFVERHGLLGALSPIVTATLSGAGGLSRASAGRLEAIEWGPFVVREPIGVLSHDSSGFFAGSRVGGILGAEILKRCRVFIDIGRGQLILELRAKTPEPYEYDRSGLFLVALGPDYRRYEVRAVEDGSPSDAAGLEPGDEIVSVERRPASEGSLEDLRARLRREPNECRLGLRRGEKKVEATIRLERRI